LLEADFQRFYHADLGEVVVRSPRRAIVLTAQLPPESGLVRQLAEGPVWTWDLELMASLLEVQHDTLRLLARGFGVKKSRLPKAFRVPRPFEKQRQKRREGPKRAATLEEVMGMLGPMMEGRHG
jgi:hypothetical protein